MVALTGAHGLHCRGGARALCWSHSARAGLRGLPDALLAAVQSWTSLRAFQLGRRIRAQCLGRVL